MNSFSGTEALVKASSWDMLPVMKGWSGIVVDPRSKVGAMTTMVKNSARPTTIWFPGAGWCRWLGAKTPGR